MENDNVTLERLLVKKMTPREVFTREAWRETKGFAYGLTAIYRPINTIKKIESYDYFETLGEIFGTFVGGISATIATAWSLYGTENHYVAKALMGSAVAVGVVKGVKGCINVAKHKAERTNQKIDAYNTKVRQVFEEYEASNTPALGTDQSTALMVQEDTTERNRRLADIKREYGM